MHTCLVVLLAARLTHTALPHLVLIPPSLPLPPHLLAIRDRTSFPAPRHTLPPPQNPPPQACCRQAPHNTLPHLTAPTGLLVPTLLEGVGQLDVYGPVDLKLSRGIAIALLILYLLYIYFQACAVSSDGRGCEGMCGGARGHVQLTVACASHLPSHLPFTHLYFPHLLFTPAPAAVHARALV